MEAKDKKEGALLSKKEVAKLLSRSPGALIKYLKKQPDFPQAWKDGTSRQARRYYREMEVLAWIEKKFGSVEP